MRKYFLMVSLVLVQSAFSQTGTTEDRRLAEKWCTEHPEGVACKHGKPVDLKLSQVSAAGTGTQNANPKPAPAAQVAPAAPRLAVAASPVAKPVDPSKLDWRFAHPKPDVLLAIKPAAILHSHLVTELLSKVSTEDKPKIDMAMAFLGRIERVQLSVHSVPGVKDPDILILVTGELDGMMRQMLSQPQVGFRQLAPNSFLLGKGANLESAVHRMSGAAAPVLADELSSSDIWIYGEPASLAATARTPLPAGLDSLKRFSLGVNFRDALDLFCNLSMLNEAGADQIMALYEMGKAQAVAQSPESSALADAAKLDRQGSQIRFRLSIPKEVLQARLSDAKGLGAGVTPSLSGMFGMFGGQGNPSPVAQPRLAPQVQPVAPPNPGKIMIYGLDEGPREVGAPKNNN